MCSWHQLDAKEASLWQMALHVYKDKKAFFNRTKETYLKGMKNGAWERERETGSHMNLLGWDAYNFPFSLILLSSHANGPPQTTYVFHSFFFFFGWDDVYRERERPTLKWIKALFMSILELLTALSAWWWRGHDNIQFVLLWTTAICFSLHN